MIRVSDKWKAVVAAAGTVVTALTAAFADDVVGVGEAGNVIAVIVAAAASVYAVYRVPNKETQ